MKRLQMLLLCVLGLFVTVGPAVGGIVFTKPDPSTVSPRPEHLAVADFNGDGLSDIAISSPRSKEVNVLLGNPDGVLTPGQVITVGNLLTDIAVGDLNGDGRQDIAVADERSDGVFIMLNLGDGTFAQPALKSVGRNPFGIAISDFDGVSGNDLAITDRAVDRVFIMLNDGRASPNFRAGGDYQVGQSPEDIIAADFNDDGAADLVTLNQGGARVKDVTMLLFSRVQAGFPVFERLANFGVGERPEHLITGDFNGDDIRDLALINRPFGSLRDGEVEFLFGQGNGFLNLVNGVDIPCPFFTNGLACRPRALGAADFDADGKIDLAVTMTDPREEKLGDILTVYTGTGDGFYAPGPVFVTDPVPAVIAIGNVTEGGLPDIFVASFRLDTIQVFVNQSTAQLDDRLPGQRCDDPLQCTTTYCEDGVCCRAECSDVERCDVDGSEGTCQLIENNRPLGFPCTTAVQCESDFCTNDTCCLVGTCPTGTRCDVPGDEGTCTLPLGNGEECSAPENCRTGNCVDGFCCDAACPNGRCDIPNKLGICTPELELGETCSLDDQCTSGICDVQGQICCATTCLSTQECSADGTSCGPITPGPNVTVTPGPPGSDGSQCTNEDQCDSGNCVNNVCCKVAACDGSLVCALGTGECATPTPTQRVTPTSTPDLSCGECPPGTTCINGFCFGTGRSSGCSTTDTSDTSDSRQVFLALLLPVGLLLARRLQAVRAKARR